MPTVLVLAVGGVVTGVLYSHERFTMPAVVSIVWNLVIIGFIIFAHRAVGRVRDRLGHAGGYGPGAAPAAGRRPRGRRRLELALRFP